MRKWQFIERELDALGAPENIISDSKMMDALERGLNINWEQKEFDYFSNLIKEDKFPIHKILMNSIYTSSKCITCTNDEKFYLLKHYDCRNKILEKYENKSREVIQEITTWLRTQIREETTHGFYDCLNQLLIVGDYILFSHGRYGILEAGKITSVTDYNISVSTTFKGKKNKFSTTLCRGNNVVLINKYSLPDEIRISLGD